MTLTPPYDPQDPTPRSSGETAEVSDEKLLRHTLEMINQFGVSPLGRRGFSAIVRAGRHLLFAVKIPLSTLPLLGLWWAAASYPDLTSHAWAGAVLYFMAVVVYLLAKARGG